MVSGKLGPRPDFRISENDTNETQVLRKAGKLVVAEFVFVVRVFMVFQFIEYPTHPTHAPLLAWSTAFLWVPPDLNRVGPEV